MSIDTSNLDNLNVNIKASEYNTMKAKADAFDLAKQTAALPVPAQYAPDVSPELYAEHVQRTGGRQEMTPDELVLAGLRTRGGTSPSHNPYGFNRPRIKQG